MSDERSQHTIDSGSSDSEETIEVVEIEPETGKKKDRAAARPGLFFRGVLRVHGFFARHKWIRRLTLAILFLAVAIRIALPFILPPVIDLVASGYGLEVDYSRMDLSILAGDVELWNLVVRPEAGGEPYVDMEYCRADVAMLELFTGDIVLRRVEVDGLEVLLERDERGRWKILDHLPEPSEEPPPEPEEPSTDPIRLNPPVRVDAARFQDVRITIRDQAVAPPIDVRVDVNVALSHLGDPERLGRLSVLAASPEMLDSLQVEGTIRTSEKRLEAVFDSRLRSLRFEAIEGILRPLGIRPTGEPLFARGGLLISADVTGKDGRQLDVSVETRPLRARAGDEVFASLDQVELIAGLSEERMHLRKLLINGGLVRAARTPAGSLRIAGFELSAVAVKEDIEKLEEVAIEQAEEELIQASEAATGEELATFELPWDVRVDELVITDLTAELRDPKLDAPLRATLKRLAVEPFLLEAPRPTSTIRLAAELGAPGVFEAAEASVSAELFESDPHILATINAIGIHPSALQPYLEEAGIESLWQSGEIVAEIETRQHPENGTFELAARNVVVRDGDELLGLSEASVTGLKVTDQKLEIAEIAARGARAKARRDTEGALIAVGFRLPPPERSSETEVVPAPEPPVSDHPEWLYDTRALSSLAESLAFRLDERIEIGRISVTENQFEWRDDALKVPVLVQVTESGFELGPITLGGTDQPVTRSGWKAWLEAVPVLERLDVQGEIGTGPATIDLGAEVAATGIDLSVLDPYLIGLGLEGHLEEGQASARFAAGWELLDDGTAALHASVTQAELRGKDHEWLGLEEAALKGIHVGREAFEIGELIVRQPRLRAERLEDGAFLALGLRVPAPSPDVPTIEKIEATDEEDAAEAAARPGGIRPAPEHSPSPEEQPTPPRDVSDPSASRPAYPVRLERALVEGARIVFADALSETPEDLELEAGFDLKSLELGAGSQAATVLATGRIGGVVGEWTVEGSLQPSPERVELNLVASASGLTSDRLNALLPSEVEAIFEEGRAGAEVSLLAEKHPDGGMRIDTSLREVLLENGGEAVLQIEGMRASLDRLDLEQRIAIDELSVTGVTTRVRRTRGGGIEALGFRVTPASGEEPPPSPERELVNRPAPSPRALRDRMIGDLPLVTLDRLELELRRLTIEDETQPEGVPIEVEQVRLSNAGPVRCLGEDPEGCPPIDLRLDGRVRPLLEEFEVLTQLSPFADEPHLTMDVQGHGLNGAAITRCFPELADRLDGSGLVDGRFHARFEALLEVFRDGAMIDWARGFSGELIVSDAAFRDGEDGEILAGVDSVRVELEKVLPDTGQVNIRSVEINTPRGFVVREKDGIRALDVFVKLPPPSEGETERAPETEEEAAEQETPGESPPGDPANPSAEEEPVPPGKAAEVRIGGLYVTGIEFTLEDRSGPSPMILPLVGLDVEVLGLTSRLVEQKKPVRFSIFTQGGTVEMPGSAGPRPVFGDVEIQGTLALSPQPSGWTKVGISGLELLNFKGPAAASGVELGGGVFDGRIDLRFEPSGVLDVDSSFIFTDLDLSEDAGGPIQQILQLPAPLNVVLFVLENEDGELRVPLSFDVSSDGLTLTQITQVALTTLSQLILDALANSPFRVLGTVQGTMQGIAPFGGGAEEPKPLETEILEFQPGTIELTARARQKLREMRRRLDLDPELQITLRHELGKEDLVQAGRRANPDPAETKELIRHRRERIVQIEQARDRLARELEAALAMGARGAAISLRQRLDDVEAERGRAEIALDELLALLRRGADRLKERRLREAALVIASERLTTSRKGLLEAGDDIDPERVRTGRPSFNAEPEQDRGRVLLELSRVRR
ncbi:MAG: DUF748 domain-containing protein [Planctomycetota bacterium]